MAEVHSIHIQVDSTQANKATNDLNKMAGATSNAEKALGNLIGIAKGLVALETLRRTASYAIEAADSFTLMSSKLKLATSSQGEYNKAQDALFKIAQDNKTALGDTVQLYSRMAVGMKEMGQSQAQTLKMVDAVSKALRISGASASEASSVITQFGQALGSGVLRGEEFNAVMENGPRLARALADGLGLPIGQLRKLAEQGQLTGDVVVKAIQSQTGALDQEASMLTMTVSQAWTQFENELTQTIGTMNEQSGTTKDLIELMNQLAPLLIDVAKGGMSALSIATDIATKELLGFKGVFGELFDMFPAFLANLDRIKGKTVAEDPEIAKLMKMGQGQATIEEIAGKPAETVEKKAAKANVALASTGKAAKKAADEAQAAFEATINANVKAAEDAAKLYEAQSRTQISRLDLELEKAQELARVEIKKAQSQEEKIKIAEQLQAKTVEIVNAELALRQSVIDKEAEGTAIKIKGIEDEIASADRLKLSQAERIKLQTELGSLQIEQSMRLEERTQAELDAQKQIQDASKSVTDIRLEGETSVREEALRTLEVLSSNLEYSKEMATGLAEAFGEIGSSIGEMTIALAQYEKQQATIEIARKEAIDKAKGDQKKIDEINQDSASKQAKAQIKLYGDMTQAAQGFFKKGTKGYEALGAAVKVFRAFEMAQSAISTAKEIANISLKVGAYIAGIFSSTSANVASVAPNVAADKAKSGASAIDAIAKAAAAPFPIGFVTGAAMLAFMVGIGAMVGGGGGGGAPAVPEPETGTGTVKGDPMAVSESISKSIGIIEENTSNDLNYSADMLEALYGIRDALGGVGDLIAETLTPAISDLTLKYGTEGVKQAGFLFRDQKLTDVLRTGELQGYIGARIETGGDEGGIKKGQTMIAKYGKEFAKEFGDVIESVVTSIQDAGKIISVSPEEIMKRLDKFKVSIGKIDIAGLSADEAAKKVEAAISAMSDSMAEKALPEFLAFQKTGEGYKETITRVAEGISRAKGSLELLGMTAIDYTEIENKRGDVAAEINRQTIMAQGDLSEGTREYVRQLQGSAADIIDSYKQILNITNLMRGAGFGTAKLDRTMINAAGGLTAFEDALTTFTENFLTPAQRVKADIATMSTEFQKFGQLLPTSREEFTKLILSIDDSTEAGRKLKGQVIGLTPAFDDFISQMDDLRATFDDTKNSIADLQSLLASDIAGLRSPEAEAALIAGTVEKAWSDLYDYMQGVVAGNERNFEYEIQQLGDIRSGVMSRYNAELGLIRQAAQAQAAAIKESADIQIGVLKDGLNAQIEAINATANAQIEAINANLDAELEMRQKAHEAALDSLQKELDAAQKLKSAVDQVRVYAMGMRLGANSMLSPEQRLQEAQRQYSGLLSRAQGGDAEAMSQLTGAADAYLESAKKYFGSSTQYANVFEGVKQAMESIGSMKVTDPDSIQAKVDVLRESQQKELQSLRDTAKEQIESIKQSSQDQISAAKDALDAQVKAIQDATKNQIDALTDPEQNEAIKALKAATIAELERVGIMLGETEYANERRSNDLETIQLEQLAEMRNQSSILSVIASNGAPDLSSLNPIGPFLPVSGDNGSLANTLNAVAIETKAGVTLQSTAFSQMIDSLGNIDDRLSKMERSQRLSA